ncbi:hypothetical protein CGCF413_v006750 [Colletotrichum fructicola]|nr:hypothetical protein CGCF413_v006750 [Colletotrichum fructicola]
MSSKPPREGAFESAHLAHTTHLIFSFFYKTTLPYFFPEGGGHWLAGNPAGVTGAGSNHASTNRFQTSGPKG